MTDAQLRDALAALAWLTPEIRRACALLPDIHNRIARIERALFGEAMVLQLPTEGHGPNFPANVVELPHKGRVS